MIALLALIGLIFIAGMIYFVWQMRTLSDGIFKTAVGCECGIKLGKHLPGCPLVDRASNS